MVIGRPQASESGILLIDKPRGITSFGVISRLRKLTGVRRIGHTGTLDPFAEGLLPVCIGRATAAVQFMDGYDKVYRLGIEFGRATDTQDLTGTTIESHTLSETEQRGLLDSDFSVLRRAVAALPGNHLQMPPMYSAIKIDGRPLYEYARKGQEVKRKSRPVRIDEAIVEQISLDQGILLATLRVACSKGTYMRTLADDLGRELGFFAHANSLTRLRCGPFDLQDAIGLEQLFQWNEQCSDQTAFLTLLRDRGMLLSMDRAFSEFPAYDITEEMAEKLINGQPQYILKEDLEKIQRSKASFCRASVPESGETIMLFSRDCLIGAAVLDPDESGQLRIKTERVMIDLADFRQIR